MNRKLYLQYWNIDQKDFRSKVSFFEKKQEELIFLDDRDRLEIEVDYLEALYQLGKYPKVLDLIDRQIEKALDLSLSLYAQLLYKKASSLFSIGDVNKAESIARQIMKIDPQNKESKMLLLQCIRKHKCPNYLLIRAFSNFLLLLSSCTIVVYWLLILPFYPNFEVLAGIVVKSLITTAIFSLVFNEIFYRLRGRRQWKNFLRDL